MATNQFEGKSIPEKILLLEAFEPGGVHHEQLKMDIISANTKIIHESLERLRESFDKNAISSDSLGRKIFWLNVVLASATVMASIVALLQFLNKCHQ